MEYAIIIIAVVVVIAAGTFIYIKKNKKDSLTASAEVNQQPSHSADFIVASGKKNELIIPVEQLPAEVLPDENYLVEITNSKVLARVNNLVPGLTQAGNAANNIAQAVQASGEVLYRAIIPASAKLANSKDIEGAVRGIYHSTDGIRGHANLVAVKAQKGTEIAANTAAAAMGVASMVVGQYYMTQINAELSEIRDSITKVADFQDNEYRSRVFSLVVHVKKIADFQAEILENDELRLSKISQLDGLEEECTQLLEQANLTLEGFTKREGLDYDAYEKTLSEAQNWFTYQKSLADVLCKISDLRYTLHLGAVSREQCTALLPIYAKQVSDTQERLTRWHSSNTKRLGIDTEEIRRKRGGLDGVIHFLPGLINDDLNFRLIKKGTAKMITAQASGHMDIQLPDDSELYEDDVQLIAKNGKIYYLPSTDKISTEK